MIHPYLVQALWSLQSRVREVDPGYLTHADGSVLTNSDLSDDRAVMPVGESLFYAHRIVAAGLDRNVGWKNAVERWEANAEPPAWKCPSCRERVVGRHTSRPFIWLGRFGKNQYGSAPFRSNCAGNVLADEFARLRPDLFPKAKQPRTIPEPPARAAGRRKRVPHSRGFVSAGARSTGRSRGRGRARR